MKDSLKSLNPVPKDKYKNIFWEYFVHEKRILDFTTNTAKCKYISKRLKFPNFYYVAMLLFPTPVTVTSLYIWRYFIRLFEISYIPLVSVIGLVLSTTIITLACMKTIRCIIFASCEWRETNETNEILEKQAKLFRIYHILSFVFALYAISVMGMLLL